MLFAVFSIAYDIYMHFGRVGWFSWYSVSAADVIKKMAPWPSKMDRTLSLAIKGRDVYTGAGGKWKTHVTAACP